MSAPEFDKVFWDELESSLPGWMSEAEARFLVENVADDKYLEIGVAYGKSLQVIHHHFPLMDAFGIDLINHGVEKKFDEVKKIYDVVSEIFGEFLKFDFRNGELRKKSDSIKYNMKKIEEIMYDIQKLQ